MFLLTIDMYAPIFILDQMLSTATETDRLGNRSLFEFDMQEVDTTPQHPYTDQTNFWVVWDI